MKQARQRESEEVWRARIEAVELSGVSALSYCGKHNIDVTSFYKWRRRLARKSTAASAFVPAVFRAEDIAMNQRVRLPEARWVAEVLVHLIRGVES